MDFNEDAYKEVERAIALSEVMQLLDPAEMSKFMLSGYGEAIEATLRSALNNMLNGGLGNS
ncbi:hypothetical protein A9Q81_11845 [Gammaproteobacteria bacterium 42_54_T18]|nr:hypothetical protein A9Q81_11845 [Gammaproteobacteria bacterium 42_54_T18]